MRDLDLVMVDTWSVGLFEEPGRRVGRALAWLRSDLTGDNGYARPIGGLLAIVDLDRMQVVRIDDHGVLPVPERARRLPRRRRAPLPRRPEADRGRAARGPSLRLDGRALSWGPWRVRIGFNPRESLTLHELAFDDGDGAGRARSPHRLSIAELAIPYADTNPTVVLQERVRHRRVRHRPVRQLARLGCDCLGEIRYLDAVVHDSRAAADDPNAICLHEEDAGILWKHYDWRSGATDVRRARRLVISSIATVGNYEYGLYWYLTLDGSIAFEAKLTGVLHTAGVAPAGDAAIGDAGRARRQRRLSPALLLRSARPGRRRRAQRALRGRRPARPAGPGNPHGQSFACARRRSRASSRRSG